MCCISWLFTWHVITIISLHGRELRQVCGSCYSWFILVDIGHSLKWLKKTLIKKNLTSWIDEKKPPKPRWKWWRKFKKTINKKYPNYSKNCGKKLIDDWCTRTSNLGGILRKNGMYRWIKDPNPGGTEEENRMMVDTLILLAPRGTLEISSLNS